MWELSESCKIAFESNGWYLARQILPTHLLGAATDGIAELVRLRLGGNMFASPFQSLGIDVFDESVGSDEVALMASAMRFLLPAREISASAELESVSRLLTSSELIGHLPFDTFGVIQKSGEPWEVESEEASSEIIVSYFVPLLDGTEIKTVISATSRVGPQCRSPEITLRSGDVICFNRTFGSFELTSVGPRAVWALFIRHIDLDSHLRTSGF